MELLHYITFKSKDNSHVELTVARSLDGWIEIKFVRNKQIIIAVQGSDFNTTDRIFPTEERILVLENLQFTLTTIQDYLKKEK